MPFTQLNSARVLCFSKARSSQLPVTRMNTSASILFLKKYCRNRLFKGKNPVFSLNKPLPITSIHPNSSQVRALPAWPYLLLGRSTTLQIRLANFKILALKKAFHAGFFFCFQCHASNTSGTMNNSAPRASTRSATG